MNSRNNFQDIKIYILTHKEIKEEYDKTLYYPLLNGSILLDEDYGYIRDDTGLNVSRLNIYLAELTGQYWAWKNSKCDIIGFCHYRRWFAKNIFFKKLEKNDIINDLKKHDIILPQKTRLKNNLFQTIKKELDKTPDYGAKIEDYKKLGEHIKINYPDYYDAYNKTMNGHGIYNNNMFICSMELANDYFTWLFSIFNSFKNELDLSKYPKNNKRVYGFFSEFLLTVYVEKNNLKVKEHYIYLSERKIPQLHIIYRRYPSMTIFERTIGKILEKL